MAKFIETSDIEHGPDYLFECPGCGCSHGVWTKKRKDYPQWTFNGDLEKPTLSPSILVRFPPNRCHSFVKEGKIQFLSDCTHDLAGKTVELPEVLGHADQSEGVVTRTS